MGQHRCDVFKRFVISKSNMHLIGGMVTDNNYYAGLLLWSISISTEL